MALLQFALVLLIATAPQDVKVSGSLSARRVAAGESIRFRIDVEIGADLPQSIELGAIPSGLYVLGTEDFNETRMSVGAGMKTVVGRVITLVAHEPGEYVIPAATITIEGRRYHTLPLTLVVTPGARSGRTNTAGEVKLRVRLDPQTIYVGEQALLEVEALFPRDLRQRQSRPASFETPSPPGFWVTELPEGLSGGIRMVDGEIYETQIYQRAYFPLGAGRFALAPARLRYELRRGYLFAPENRELVSDSPRINVLPLPAEGKPPSFTGAVGRYTVHASIEPGVVATGDAAQLTVEIRGLGNVKALPPPQLPYLPGLEIYPPTEDARVNVTNDVIGGTKRFSWVLVAEDVAEIKPGPIEYAFFDPKTRSYDVVRSQPLELSVVEGKLIAGVDTVIRAVHRAKHRSSLSWVRTPMFGAVQVLPLVLLAGAVLSRRARTGTAATRRRAQRERAAALTEIRAVAAAISDREFLGRLATLIRSSSADHVHKPELRAAPPDRVRELLVAAGVSAYAANAASALLKRLDNARFAQDVVAFAERDAMLAEARDVLDRIARESRSDPPSAGGVALALIVFSVAATAAQATPRDSLFTAGVDAYLRNNYLPAIDSFESYVQAAPLDPEGWYNLGNSYHESGQRGRAIWAWRRTLEVEPRHLDARHNLRITGADLALASAPPVFTPTREQLAIGFAITWWMGALAVALRILRGHRAPLGAAIVAVLAAAIIGLTALPAVLRPDTAITLDDPVPLLAGPDLRSETVVPLAAGTTTRILEARGDWLRLETVDRVEGWGEAGRFGRM